MRRFPATIVLIFFCGYLATGSDASKEDRDVSDNLAEETVFFGSSQQDFVEYSSFADNTDILPLDPSRARAKPAEYLPMKRVVSSETSANEEIGASQPTRELQLSESDDYWCGLLEKSDEELFEMGVAKSIAQYCFVQVTSGTSAACDYYAKGRPAETGYDGIPLTPSGLGTGCITTNYGHGCYYRDSDYSLTDTERDSMCTGSIVANGAAQLRYGIRNGYCTDDPQERCASEDTIAPSAGDSVPNTNGMVYFTLQYRFADGYEEEPTEDAVKSLICQTNLFIRDQLRRHTGDDTLQAEATNINWNYDEERFEEFEMSFTANVTTNDYQATVPLQTVFEGMEVRLEDILRYIEFYIWESQPTLYWQEVVASNFTNDAQIPIPLGQLDRYDCPATEAPSVAPTISPAPTASNVPSAFPTVSPAPTGSPAPSTSPSISPSPTTPGASNGTDELVRFNFRFGFFEDEWTPDTDIMKDDVEGVMCQTQYFLSQLLQNATDSKSIHVKATEITWGYYEGQELPGHINFTIKLTDSAVEGDVDWVDAGILITLMENLGMSGLQEYITNWVWSAEPIYNFFLNANRMGFDGMRMMAPVKGQLEGAECPDTNAPTIAPTQQTQPTILSPDLASDGASCSSNEDCGFGYFCSGLEICQELNCMNWANHTPNGVDYYSERPCVGEGAEEGTAFCGWDGNCYYYNCENWFQFGPVAFTGYDPNKPVELVCEDYTNGPEENLNSVTFGCRCWDPYNKAPERISWTHFFNRKCEAKPRNDDTFTCFDNRPQTSYNDFLGAVARLNPPSCDRETYLPLGIEQPIYWYIIQMWQERANLEETIKYKQGRENTKNSASFNPNLAEKTMFATIVSPDPAPQQSLPGDAPYQTLSPGSTGGSGPNDASSVAPTVTSMPTSSNVPTFSGPTVSQAPSASPTTSPAPTATATPTITPMPTAAGGGANQLGPSGRQKITCKFLVSNINNITASNEVNNTGLALSWSYFAAEVVQNITEQRYKRIHLQAGGRRLAVGMEPGSASIDLINLTACPEGSHINAQCHNTTASYNLLLRGDEDGGEVQFEYGTKTIAAVDDGTYQAVLDRVAPEAPFVIGKIPEADAQVDSILDSIAPSLIMNISFIIYSNIEIGSEQIPPEYVELLEEAFGALVDFLFVAIAGDGVDVATDGENRRLARELLALLAPESSKIDSIEPTECPDDGNEIPTTSACYTVNGEYTLLLVEGENKDTVINKYESATEAALEEGKLQEILIAADPDSPLVVWGLAPQETEPNTSGCATGKRMLSVVLGAAVLALMLV